jgi:hypothetical protein
MDLLAMILRAKLMSPADRKFKKPKPGKKKVVKWPKTLEHAQVCGAVLVLPMIVSV